MALSLIHISFGAAGATTNLFPSVTLGAVNAGQGITSDNVSPMNLVYLRRVARGVKREPWKAETAGQPQETPCTAADREPDPAALLRLILDQLTVK